jgi:hypothetical protein
MAGFQRTSESMNSRAVARKHISAGRARWLAFALAVAWLLTATYTSLAGRPLVVDDAEPVPTGHLELEFGASYARLYGGGREQVGPVMTAAYGIVDFLEFGLGIQRVNNDLRGEPPARGFEDLHLLAKFRFLEENDIAPAAALSLDVSVPTANKSKGLSTGNSDQAFTLILSKLYEPAGLHLNLGYQLVDSPRGEKLKNRVTGGIAGEYALSDAFTLVGEIFGASRAAQGDKNEAAFQLGARYAVSPGFVLDAAAGRSLRSSDTSVQGTMGFTWTVDIARLLAGAN